MLDVTFRVFVTLCWNIWGSRLVFSPSEDRNFTTEVCSFLLLPGSFSVIVLYFYFLQTKTFQEPKHWFFYSLRWCCMEMWLNLNPLITGLVFVCFPVSFISCCSNQILSVFAWFEHIYYVMNPLCGNERCYNRNDFYPGKMKQNFIFSWSENWSHVLSLRKIVLNVWSASEWI